MKHLEILLLKKIHPLSMICLTLIQIESLKALKELKMPPQPLKRGLQMVAAQ